MGGCRARHRRDFGTDVHDWRAGVTHWFLDTVDQASLLGKDAYGYECIKMADSDAECAKVLNNADNWAFYICEYCTDEEAGDWRNFSEAELRHRPALVPGGYNVEQSLIARYN